MQLADLFNLSSVTVISPSVPKTTEVVPVFKKDLKLHYSNYSPVSQLSNIEKILEKCMYKRLYTILNNNNIYTLQFGFRQHYSTSHVLINVTENIIDSLDDSGVSLLVLTPKIARKVIMNLDLSKESGLD